MPKKDGDDFILSEHGNWNVAADYSRLKIMKPLYLCDEYETIATFGHLDFYDEVTQDINVDSIKIRGFKRLVKTLILVISNSKFAIQSKEKEKLLKYDKELKRYYKIVQALYTYKKNDLKKTKELIIHVEKYDKALDRILEIKSLINEPLNKYDLIFTHKEDFDVKKYKKQIIEDAIQRG